MESMEGKSTTDGFVEPTLIDVRANWSCIKPHIEKLLKENPTQTFIPEDVYCDCINEKAYLFASPVGFLILTIEIDRYTKDKTLYMWIAYTYKKGTNQWVAHADWLNKVAKHFGCKYIEAQSNVDELEPYALKHGWSLDTRIYRRNVK